MHRLRRHHRSLNPIALTNALGTTTEIDTSTAAGGNVLIPAGSPITSLTYYGASAPGGAYVAVQDQFGSAVTQTVAAGKGYPLPDACFGYAAIKLVANTSANVELSLKG